MLYRAEDTLESVKCMQKNSRMKDKCMNANCWSSSRLLRHANVALALSPTKTGTASADFWGWNNSSSNLKITQSRILSNFLSTDRFLSSRWKKYPFSICFKEKSQCIETSKSWTPSHCKRKTPADQKLFTNSPVMVDKQTCFLLITAALACPWRRIC